MKLNKLFAMGAIALGLIACNKDNNGLEDQEKNATLSVRVATPTTTRAVGNLDGDTAAGIEAERKIHKTQVWVFAGDVKDGYGEANGPEVLNITVKTGERKMYVLVNAQGLSENSTIAEIEAAAYTIADANIPTSGFLMTPDVDQDGRKHVILNIKPGKNTYGITSTLAESQNKMSENKNLMVKRVASRVAIKEAKLELTDNTLFDNLKNVEVAMFNVNKSVKAFSKADAVNEVITGKLFIGAEWSKNGAYDEANTEIQATFADQVQFPIAAAAAPYFYVAPYAPEATAASNQMLIVLRGKPYKGDNPVMAPGLYTDENGYTYYKVVVGVDGIMPTPDAQKIMRNTRYNISLTIKKIGNPTIDPAQSATLDVKCEVEPWVDVQQDVTWE